MTLADVLLSDLNPFDPLVADDPYPRYRALREFASAAPGPYGIWLLSSYRGCATALRDPRFGHLETGEEPVNPLFGRLGDDGDPLREADGSPVYSFIVLNPPGHTRVRQLLAKAFTARMIEELRPRISRIVDELLDKALAKDQFDVIAELAYPLPVTVISQLLGVPSADYELFSGWCDDIVRGLDPLQRQNDEIMCRLGIARREFFDYFMELVRRRRLSPSNDLLTAMVETTVDGDRLTDAEVVVTSTLLLIAGHETTANLIGNSVYTLLRHPEQLRLLRQAGTVSPEAIEELLRFESPGKVAGRVARTDVEVEGVLIPRGHGVLALLGAANRDPKIFSEPDRLDVTRIGARHLAFGHGIHLCLGNLLAKVEGRIVLERLFVRAPRLALIEPRPRWRADMTVRGLTSLTVRPN